jgi:hypothetical protein
MHKREIMKLHGLVAQKGYTLVPLSLYFSGANVKMESVFAAVRNCTISVIAPPNVNPIARLNVI